MKWMRCTLGISICLLMVGCSGDNRIFTIAEFIDCANANGIEVERQDPQGSTNSIENQRKVERFVVLPDPQYIWFVVAESPRAAKEAASAENQDLGLIMKRVRDEGPLCEMAGLPKAHARGNLVLYVPLSGIVYYPKVVELIDLFENF